jgi:hypothetical protein
MSFADSMRHTASIARCTCGSVMAADDITANCSAQARITLSRSLAAMARRQARA